MCFLIKTDIFTVEEHLLLLLEETCEDGLTITQWKGPR